MGKRFRDTSIDRHSERRAVGNVVLYVSNLWELHLGGKPRMLGVHHGHFDEAAQCAGSRPLVGRDKAWK